MGFGDRRGDSHKLRAELRRRRLAEVIGVGTRGSTETILPRETRDFAWYRDVLDSLQNLMTVLVGKPVFPKTVNAWAARDESFCGVPNATLVELLFNQPPRTLPPPRESNHVTTTAEDVLLPLPSIAPDLTRIFNSWFRTAES